MAKFMRTIADRRDEIAQESLSTQPLLTNDYTYGNIQDVSENITNKISNEESTLEGIENEKEDRGNEPEGVSESEMEKLKEIYPVQQVCSVEKTEFTVEEIQDSVDELNVDSTTRERG